MSDRVLFHNAALIMYNVHVVLNITQIIVGHFVFISIHLT